MFLFKKIIPNFFFPTTFIVMLLGTGIILLWFAAKKKQYYGRILVTIGTCLLLLFSNTFFSNLMLRPFEKSYQPAYFQLENFKERAGRYPVEYVVVLGGGHSSDPNLPITSHLSGSSLVRLVEGIRLHRYFKGSKLVLSGGGVYEKTAEAESMNKVALGLGIEQDNLIIESKSRDTKDQARLVKEIVGSKLFVLVTSASHMQRAMALFEKQGLNPFPAPTGHSVKKTNPGNPNTYFPSAGNTGKSGRAVYEMLGILWAKIRGQTGEPRSTKNVNQY